MKKGTSTIKVRAKVLKWARDSIGLSLEQTAEISKISFEQIKTWESEDSDVKITDLKKIAKAYKRMLSFFFLENPPEISPIPNDFRTLDSADINSLSTEVRLAIRKAQRNRKFYAYLNDLTDLNNVKIPKINLDVEPKKIATKLRNFLEIDLETQKGWESENYALNRWIDLMERKFIPVFQITLPKTEIRGFCLREDNLPPVVVINANDNIRARIFTLFHEFYHLLIVQTEIDKLIKLRGQEIAHKIIEAKANEFAGSFLVPDDDLLVNKFFRNYIETKEERYITSLVNQYKVSAEVIYRKFVNLGYLTQEEYEKKREDLRIKYEQKEIEKNKRNKEKNKGFIPDYYRDVLKASGYDLTKRAFSAMIEGKISTNELVTFLGIKIQGLSKIEYKTFEHYKQKDSVAKQKYD